MLISVNSAKKSDYFENQLESEQQISSAEADEIEIELPKEPLEDVFKEITITAVGDMTLGFDVNFPTYNRFDTVLNSQDDKYNYPLKNVRHIFESDDLTIANLEGTLTRGNNRYNKTFAFKGDPEYVKIMSENGIDVAILANNHIYDYGQEGYDDTIEALEKADILPIGTNIGSTSPIFNGGLDFDLSEIVDVDGIKVGLLAYKGWSLDQDVLEKIKSDIERFREKAHVIVVNYHWGDEGSHRPNPVQIELGRYTIDKGADMVIGHHPHVLQGIENYKGRNIAYSLGNFVFGGNQNPRNKDTMIYQNTFRVNVTQGEIAKIEENIIPARISSVMDRNDYQPIILQGQEALDLESRIEIYNGYIPAGE